MPEHLFPLDEEHRQAILLALALLALKRPGWDWMLGEIAQRLEGAEMYEQFKAIHHKK